MIIIISELYNKHNYLNKDIKFINNESIIEYDMKNAGINILLYNNILNDNDFKKLMSLSKLDRNISVGKFLKNNPDVNEFLINEFINIRKDFFNLNNIEDNNVLSIKKDAVVLINKTASVTKLNDFYEFLPKEKSNSYININNKEHYYNIENNLLITKGYSEEVKMFQKDYIFKFLSECLLLLSVHNKDNLFEKCIVFKDNYVKKNLDFGYYKDIYLNKYIFQINSYLFEKLVVDKELLTYCNINNNLNFIIELFNTIL